MNSGAFANYNPVTGGAFNVLNTVNPQSGMINNFHSSGNVIGAFNNSAQLINADRVSNLVGVQGIEHVPPRVISHALSGEFMELEDLLNINIECDEVKSIVDESGNVQLRVQKSKKCITSAFKWLEAWGVYQIILCNSFGLGIFNESARYSAFMLDLFQKYKFGQVINYDVRHRGRLASTRSFAFSSIDYDLYLRFLDISAVKGAGTGEGARGKQNSGVGNRAN
jgi:hypothetical protein